MSPLLKKRSDIKLKLITKYCLQSALYAFIIMAFTYAVHSNTLTGGDNTVLRMDLYHQYGPLYSELYDRITQGGSLIYSWTSGLGGGFLGNLFNYCCSPFALVLFIVGHKNMPEAIALMILLKAVFASTAFTYFINKSNDRAEKISVAFGLLYAFSGYFVAYSWNIMWLDAMAVFPLVMLGIENIINRKKPALFIFGLAYTMITNYYMAYMVCLLSVIYFLYYYFGVRDVKKVPEKLVSAYPSETEENIASESENKKRKRKKGKIGRFLESDFYKSGILFTASAFLCFLLAAFALMPVVYALGSSSATSSSYPDKLRVYFNFFDFIANHLPAVEPTIRSSGDIVLPNIYCGIISIILLPFFFMSNRISGRQKIAAVMMLGMFYLSFSINYLNFIWHGLHFPNDLPYRFSFAYSFILLTLVYKVLLNYDEFSKKDYVTAGVALIAFVVITEKLGSHNVEDKTIYMSLIFTLFYVAVFGIMKSSRFTKRTVSSLIVYLVIVEILFCNTANYSMAQPKKSYASDYDSYQSLKNTVEGEDTDLFYRTELSKLRTRMDPCWYGYNGVSTFSSMAYEHTSALMKKLGLFGNNINSYTYYPQTPIFNSFLGLKYVYDNSDYLSEGVDYSLVASNETFTAYEYKHPLPIAFAVDGAIKDWDISSSDPFIVQNMLMQNSTGVAGVLEDVDASEVTVTNLNSISADSVNGSTTFSFNKIKTGEEGTAEVIINVEQAGEYYVYAGSTKLSRLKINADDFAFDYLSSSIQPITIGVGYQEVGSQIKIEYTVDKANDSGNITFCAARTNDEKFAEAYNKILKNGTIKLDSFEENSFTGTINVTNQNGFLFTSVPYDESWEIIVDGVPLEYYDAENDTVNKGKIIAVGNGLIGFDLSQGSHSISFRYVAQGLKTGIMLSVIGWIILIILIIVYFVRKKKTLTHKDIDEDISEHIVLDNAENALWTDLSVEQNDDIQSTPENDAAEEENVSLNEEKGSAEDETDGPGEGDPGTETFDNVIVDENDLNK